MICYPMICYPMLCYTMLYYAMLCYATLCCMGSEFLHQRLIYKPKNLFLAFLFSQYRPLLVYLVLRLPPVSFETACSHIPAFFDAAPPSPLTCYSRVYMRQAGNIETPCIPRSHLFCWGFL